MASDQSSDPSKEGDCGSCESEVEGDDVTLPRVN